MKLLFVDDNKAAREISKVYFEKAGHELDVAASASEAMQKIANNLYDIVITDIQMPVISGLELAKWVHVNYPEIKVIYASCYWERALKLGVDFIKKPLTYKGLMDKIEKKECA